MDCLFILIVFAIGKAAISTTQIILLECTSVKLSKVKDDCTNKVQLGRWSCLYHLNSRYQRLPKHNISHYNEYSIKILKSQPGLWTRLAPYRYASSAMTVISMPAVTF